MSFLLSYKLNIFRSEINILLCGDPGTSKSQLLQVSFSLCAFSYFMKSYCNFIHVDQNFKQLLPGTVMFFIIVCSQFGTKRSVHVR